MRRAGCCTELAVRACAPVALAAVRQDIDRAIGSSAGTTWWRGRERLHDDSVVGADLRSGSIVDVERTGDIRAAAGVLALHQVGGPDAGRVVALGRRRLTIGRDPGCDVPVVDPDASRRHACLEITGAGATIYDLQSTNGTTVDGEPVPPAGRPVRPGERIRVGDSTFRISAPSVTPATVQDTGDGALQVLRPPRRIAATATEPIEVPSLSPSARPRGVQWAAALVPAAAGGAIAWFAHSPQFLLFALLSPVIMLSTSVGDRLHWSRSRRREAAGHSTRRAIAQAQIDAALTAETTARHEAAPDPAAIGLIAALPATRLWERRGNDPDFLTVRLGTADRPSSTCRREGSRVAPAGRLSGVPACISLRDGPLGVSAPAAVLDGMARSLVGQLAVLHSATDLELVLLLSRPTAWRWCRWLPHWLGDVPNSPSDLARTVAELADDIDRQLAARRHAPDGWTGRWRVLVIDRAAAMADVPGLAALLARGRVAGITAVCLDEDASALPNSCASILRATGITGHRAVLEQAGSSRQPDVLLDTVSPAWADDLARNLAPLVDAGADAAALPSSCALLPALGLARPVDTGADAAAHIATEITARWAAGDGSAATTIGVGADGPLRFDLTADGPHALIAGTTGAGKSELLRSIVVGLAVDHPPDLLNFLLIDYKGGATFAECARLPHTSGLVTDLDPFLTSRALRSLDSELRRRERLFADAGVVDLTAFRSHPAAEPLPRLVIVVDEFATLADELPDFLRGLVSVAQRGRSLGVHLVLATQRPGSAVTPEIRANTSLRLALRVTDPGESSDVIDTPDAAFIDRRCPGRAFLRSGAALTNFQAAHTGRRADTPDRPVIELLDEWGRPLSDTDAATGPTDLDILVEAIATAHRSRPRAAARSPWLPPLEHRIPRRPSGSGDRLHVPYAVADQPDRQQREVVSFDLRGSSLLVVGAAGSGRTEALGCLAVAAAERLDAAQLHLYVLDAHGRLAAAADGLPQAATVVGPRDLDLAPVLLRRLARRGAEGPEAPALRSAPAPLSLLLIDDWDALTSTLADSDAIECADLLAAILRNGSRSATAVAVSGGRACLAPRLAANFETKMLLRLADVADYGMAGIAPRSVPGRFLPGRGVRAGDSAEVQFLCVSERDGPDELRAAADEVAAHCSTAAPAAGPGRRPVRLRPLPDRLLFDEVPVRHNLLVLGVGGDEAQPVYLDPSGPNGRFLVAGPPRAGRTTVLRSLLRQALLGAVPVAVAAPVRSALAAEAAAYGAPLVLPEDAFGQVEARLGNAALVLIDDCEMFLEGAAGDALLAAARTQRPGAMFIAAGRSDELATSYRGIGAYVRRDHCGLLLRPGPVDGELLGTRLPRRPSSGPPGRGVVVGLAATGDPADTGEPRAVQVALPPDVPPRDRPERADDGVATCQPMCG